MSALDLTSQISRKRLLYPVSPALTAPTMVVVFIYSLGDFRDFRVTLEST